MPKQVGDIGLPRVVHPRNADTAWVFPMDGTTLAELLADLDRQFPGLRFRVVDEQDTIGGHMRFSSTASRCST